jgi:hypothetical protein
MRDIRNAEIGGLCPGRRIPTDLDILRDRLAAWDEDWEDHNPCLSFPLRELAPDAGAYILAHACFTPRDMRVLARTLAFDFSGQDRAGLIDHYLDLVEKQPWMAPALDCYIASHREGARTKGRRPGARRRVGDVARRIGCARLALSNRPDLAGRVAEFHNEHPDTDLAVAGFCEYARAQFTRCLRDLDEPGFDRLVRETLRSFSAGDPELDDDAFEDIDDLGETDWEDPDPGRDALDTTDIAQIIAAGVSDITAAIRILARSLRPDSTPAAFEAIALLAEAARAEREADGARAAWPELLGRLRALGIEVPTAPDDIGPEVLDALPGMIASVEERQSRIVAQTTAADEAHAAVGTALAAGCYAELGALGAAAEAAKATLQALLAEQHAAHGALAALVTPNGRPRTDTPARDRIHPAADGHPGDIPESDRADDADASRLGDDKDAIPVETRQPGADSVEGSTANPAGSYYATPASPPVTTPVTSRADHPAANPDPVSGTEAPPGSGLPDTPATVSEVSEPSLPGSADPAAPPRGTSAPETRPSSRAGDGESRETPADPGDGVPPHDPLATPDPMPGDDPVGRDGEDIAEVARLVGQRAADSGILAGLIERNLIGIAADTARTLERVRGEWPVSAATLRTAAAARAPLRDYSQDTARFTEIADPAIAAPRGDLDAVILLGALLRPAIFQRHAAFRSRIVGLARGLLGQHLIEIAEAVAELPFDFPPGSDELARMAGGGAQRPRLIERLGSWCETTARRTSRWQAASVFMHHSVSDDGPIGRARRAMEAGRPDALALAREALDLLGTPEGIETQADQHAQRIGRHGDTIYPRSLEYLHRTLAEGLGLLADWVEISEASALGHGHSETRLRTAVENLLSRLDKATMALEDEARRARGDSRALDAATAAWLALRCTRVRGALTGQEATSASSLDDALGAERDLLPSGIRRMSDESAEMAVPLLELVADGAVPEPAVAYAAALREGAFDVAMRIALRHGCGSQEAIVAEKDAFVAHWSAEIDRLQQRLKSLAQVDYAHQAEIGRHQTWCAMAQASLRGSAGTEADFSEIPDAARALEIEADAIERTIRADQARRIADLRTQNAEEADALLAALDTQSMQAIENRIAQLRDGRSAAIVQSEAGQLVACFVPDFVTAAAAPAWPADARAYAAAFAAPGLLFTESDRRDAAQELIETYLRAVEVRGDRPSLGSLRDLLELIGFDRVLIGQPERLGGGGRAWSMRMTGHIATGDWFVPPIFGSAAISGYKLYLIGASVLPETIQKALDPKVPSILLLAGTADLARRREYAGRLRGAGVPALLVDEALIAYAATRRDTRVRTVLECGLPFGRIEPYTTDAGQIPPEMFFGRKAEITKIMSRTADGCLVYGGRQLGKSALLSHVARVFHAPVEKRIVVRREVKPLGNAERSSEIWTHLATMLHRFDIVRPERGGAESVGRDIRNWLATNPGGQIVCLFDETDHFMTAETRADYPELSRLKELMEDTGRAFKVVFAGLHNVQRTFVTPNSPLAHLGEPICIGPLNRTPDDKRAAHDLVVAPMQAAGFRFERDDDVDEILAWANYYPSLVQEYSKGLLATLHGAGSGKAYRIQGDGPLWTIPHAELFGHRGFQAIETRVRDKFHLTLDLDARYALIAYTLAWLNTDGDEQKALVTGYRPEELLTHAKAFWPKTAELPSRTAFEALLEEMFDLGVLGRIRAGQSQSRYCLASRQVAAMLGTKDDILDTLETLEEKDPTIAYDRSIHRRIYAPALDRERQQDGPYCPLTDLQIEQLVGEGREPVGIVCGLEALGLGKVATALKRLSEDGQLPGLQRAGRSIGVDVVTQPNALNAAVSRVLPNRDALRIVVYTPAGSTAAKKALDWLATQHAVLAGRVRPIVVLDAADPGQRELAVPRRESTVWLTAWGSEMLRVHLHNIEKDGSDLDTRGLRDAILMATGGIPIEVTRLVGAVTNAENPDAVIADWTPSSHGMPEIVDSTIGRVLALIDEETLGDDYATLDQLVLENVGSDLLTIGPDLLAMGLASEWNPKARRLRRSALGGLIALQIERRTKSGISGAG